MWFTRGRVRELKNAHNSVTVQNWTHVYMNFFDHKDLGNHLLQVMSTSRETPYIYIYIYRVWNTLYIYIQGVKYFGRVFLMLNYADITQNIYIQSWTVTELMAIEKCGLLWCPRTVRRPWRNIHPLRHPGKQICSCSDLDERFLTR